MRCLGKSQLVSIPVTIASLIGLTLFAASPSGAVQVRACQLGLATAISWEHSDPAHMGLIPAVQWQNCKGRIRKVVLETRLIDRNGGLLDSETRTYTADVVHKPSGVQFYGQALYNAYTPIGLSFTSRADEYGFKSCTQFVDGRTTDMWAGVTFYNVARAYDKRGRKILEKISPPVACDQNG